MKIRLVSLAFAILLSFGVHAADQPSIDVRGEFAYATNPDSGIFFTICPDQASRKKDAFLAKHECFIARNIEVVSKWVEGKLRIPTLENIDYECGYSGTGIFVVSSFKSRKEEGYEGMVTIADAIVNSTGDLHLVKKDCASAVSLPALPDLKTAIAFERSGDYDEAWKIFEVLADQGNPMAQLYLGLMFYQGHGTEKDNLKAYLVFTEAMASDNVEIRKRAAGMRSKVLKEMSPAQIQKANQWIEKYLPSQARAAASAGDRGIAIAPVRAPSRRVPYSTVFKTNADGSVSPRMPVRLQGVKVSGNVSFTRGVSFNGTDVAAMKGKDVEIVRTSDYVDIKRFY